MSYADDFEDVGGYLAEQDSFIEDCEEYEGNCKACPNQYQCDASDYNVQRKRKYFKYEFLW